METFLIFFGIVVRFVEGGSRSKDWGNRGTHGGSRGRGPPPLGLGLGIDTLQT